MEKWFIAMKESGFLTKLRREISHFADYGPSDQEQRYCRGSGD